MKFKLFVENIQINLPPIPPGMVRLTNFTNLQYANSIMQTGFRYGKGLTSTTDAFRSNNDIINLIQSGEVGGMIRTSFGNVVILIDVSYNESKLHTSPLQKPHYIDKSRVLGYVDRQTGQLTQNPNYNPTQPVDYPANNNVTTNRPSQKMAAQSSSPITTGNPAPIANNGGEDIW